MDSKWREERHGRYVCVSPIPPPSLGMFMMFADASRSHLRCLSCNLKRKASETSPFDRHGTWDTHTLVVTHSISRRCDITLAYLGRMLYSLTTAVLFLNEAFCTAIRRSLNGSSLPLPYPTTANMIYMPAFEYQYDIDGLLQQTPFPPCHSSHQSLPHCI